MEVIRGKSREAVSDVLSNEKEKVTREPGKIIRLPKASLNVGGISRKKYERRHGLREEPVIKQLYQKKITQPIGRAGLAVGDLAVKSYLRSALDFGDFFRLRWSDKHNNYTRGAFPLGVRIFGIGGLLNIASTLIGNTSVGKKIIKYRENRRDRIDRFKQWSGAPIRRGASEASSQLPLYEKRYGATQKVRQKRENFEGKVVHINSLINDGIGGVIARGEQKKKLRQQKEQRSSNAISLNEEKRDTSFTPSMQIMSSGRRRKKVIPEEPIPVPPETPPSEEVPIAA